MKAITRILALLLVQYHASLPACGEATASAGVVSFSLATDTEEPCDTGLSNTGVFAVLDYRQIVNVSEQVAWIRLGEVSLPPLNGSTDCAINSSFSFNFTYNTTTTTSTSAHPQVQFRLVQWEHGGGYCNCWGVVSDSLTVKTEDDNDIVLNLL